MDKIHAEVMRTCQRINADLDKRRKDIGLEGDSSKEENKQFVTYSDESESNKRAGDAAMITKEIYDEERDYANYDKKVRL